LSLDIYHPVLVLEYKTPKGCGLSKLRYFENADTLRAEFNTDDGKFDVRVDLNGKNGPAVTVLHKGKDLKIDSKYCGTEGATTECEIPF